MSITKKGYRLTVGDPIKISEAKQSMREAKGINRKSAEVVVVMKCL